MLWEQFKNVVRYQGWNVCKEEEDDEAYVTLVFSPIACSVLIEIVEWKNCC